MDNYQNTQDNNWQNMNGEGISPQNVPGAAPSKPVKAPKKWLLFAGISVAVVGIGAIGAFALTTLGGASGTGYGESYRLAKKVQSGLSDVSASMSCGYVEKYANNTTIDEQGYEEYITECSAGDNSTLDIVRELSESDGVRKNAEIKAQFERFDEVFQGTIPNSGELSQRLEMYRVWHRYELALKKLLVGQSTDDEIRTVANVLIYSESKILRDYGEGWLAVTLPYAQAARDYENASWSDSNKNKLKQELAMQRTAQSDYVKQNKPDLTVVASLRFGDITGANKEFAILYNMIKEEYEQHYDEDSGDCSVLLDTVVCY